MWFDEAQSRHLFSLAPEDLNDHRARVKNPVSVFLSEVYQRTAREFRL